MNDPGVADITFSSREDYYSADEPVPEDHVRIYVPIDLSSEAILRRLNYVINRYGEATEANEFAFDVDVRRIITLLSIYDQFWCDRHVLKESSHSPEGKALAESIIKRLDMIPDGCAECFPFDLIDELRKEYGE